VAVNGSSRNREGRWREANWGAVTNAGQFAPMVSPQRLAGDCSQGGARKIWLRSGVMIIQKTGWKERPLRVSERLFNYTCCRFRLPAGLVTATFNPLLSDDPLDHANAALSTDSCRDFSSAPCDVERREEELI